MAKPAKFVAISVSSVTVDDGDVVDSVYTLDSEGRVWFLNQVDSRWERMTDERFGDSEEEAD